ncbi:MAG: TetR/AcrR family transcriptional regulator [Acidimicrobiia bacterium]|nr:TetR/AcrR family transcriptional regulator [Acidimicrobiia bacterium]
MAEKRSYRSPLRKAQAGQTRELILASVCELASAGHIDDLSMRQLADSAGVSERTIYRYFPDRQALLNGLTDWLSERMGTGPLESTVTTIDELAEIVPEVFGRFDAEAQMARAAMLVGPDPANPTEDARRRSEMMSELITASFPDLTEAERHGLLALVRSLVNSGTWWRMREEFGLTGRDSGALVGWMLKTAFTEVRRTGTVGRMGAAPT